MTPLESCLSVCAMLARCDRPEGLPIAVREIDRYESKAGGDHYRRARALETLAFQLAIEAVPTAIAADLDRMIAARIRALGSRAA